MLVSVYRVCVNQRGENTMSLNRRLAGKLQQISIIRYYVDIKVLTFMLTWKDVHDLMLTEKVN